MPHTSKESVLLPTLLVETDRCVMCGLCSQHCPTYALTLDENESPRGRIALISAFNKQQLNLNDKLVTHLENCTLCRACEDFCPSAVRFGVIIDEARMLIAKNRPSVQHQKMKNVLSKPESTRRLGKWLERYQRWGLQRLMRATGLLSFTRFAQSERLLPPIRHVPTLPEYSPSAGNHRGDIALFTGCVSSIVDREALDASRRLLNQLGYGVYTPVGQTCCGALHQHSGQPDKAADLARTNLAIFNALDIEAIVHTSTGCTSLLKEYNKLSALAHDQQESAESFVDKVQDINEFLTSISWPPHLTINPLPKNIAVHEPCSARNVLHINDNAYQLLELIPKINLISLPGNDRCCGAAGSQLLTSSSFAKRLRQEKIDAFLKLEADLKSEFNKDTDTLVTTNIGCALHLAAGLREHGKNVEVLHPVTLLLRQIEILEQNLTSQQNRKMDTCT